MLIVNYYDTEKQRVASLELHTGEHLDGKTMAKVISHVKEIQADGHELDLIKENYPTMCSKAIVQRFYGDEAKRIFYNVF